LKGKRRKLEKRGRRGVYGNIVQNKPAAIVLGNLGKNVYTGSEILSSQI